MLTLKLAWRNIFRNTRRTLLTVTLIAFSLVSLILSDALAIGLIEIMTGSVTETIGGEVQIHRRGFLDNYDVDLVIDEPQRLTDQLDADSGVRAYAPRVMAGGMITSTYNVSGGMIYGVDAQRELAVSRIRSAIVDGDYLSGKDREILIGEPMADLLEVELGDRIILTVAEIDTGEISQELFRLSGIFKFGPTELDDNLIFINLPTAQRLVALDGGIHQIVVMFHTLEDGKNRELPLLKSLNDDNIEAIGWMDFNPGMGSMLEMSSYITLIIGIVLFLLASLGVVNSMFMSIYERIYEFGIARAIGTTPYQILRLVMLEALLIAVISCIVGDIMGYVSNRYFETNGVPMGEFELSGVAFTFVYTRLTLEQYTMFPVYVTILTLVAAIYPAIFASRITPAKALQRSL
jgi:ABC-type lipoprotein release transport system permease subunit